MKVINRGDLEFPDKLLKIKPLVEKIYIEGDSSILNEFGIAIIGSRNSSKEGEKIANDFAYGLSKIGINIISGLAIGIDSIAHRGCISSGEKTIAVIGSGFNHIYPKENKKLYEKILETGGAVVSEYPPETKVKSEYFPKRNRIISGLSSGILVIEGKTRSGTTITAKYGLNQKKPVFCIPHSIYNPYGTGPNRIIQKGGILVTSVNDIVEFFVKNGNKFENTYQKEKEYKNIIDKNFDDEILNLLSKKQLSKEELIEKTNLSISEINQRLTILELEGFIKEEIGKGYKIVVSN